MSTTHRARSQVFGMATVFALTLLAPPAVTAEKEAAALAPVTAPTVDGTGAYAVRAARALAAERPLLTGDVSSMQEEACVIVVATSTASDETRSADYLPAALASGTRSETAHLATLVLPD